MKDSAGRIEGRPGEIAVPGRSPGKHSSISRAALLLELRRATVLQATDPGHASLDPEVHLRASQDGEDGGVPIPHEGLGGSLSP